MGDEMGISLAICSLSEKREAMLREDPALVWDLSRDVPGYLEVGKAWDALRVAAQPFDSEALMSNLFGGALGKSFGEPGGFGKPRIVPKFEVARLAAVMGDIPPRFMRDNAGSLRGIDVHGRFFHVDNDEGQTPDAVLESEFPELADLADVGDDTFDATLERLEDTFERVRALVVRASERGEALLVVFR